MIRGIGPAYAKSFGEQVFDTIEAETATRLTNRPELRGFLRARNCSRTKRPVERASFFRSPRRDDFSANHRGRLYVSPAGRRQDVG